MFTLLNTIKPLLALLFANVILAQQTPLVDVKHLSQIQPKNHKILSHAAFPKHRVRLTRVEGFCDTTVATYTGYVDIEAKHLFFWFFESRSNPDEDDVVLWVNGGPGGSSTMGMLMELGPCSIDGPNGTVYNPYGWNEKANMIFLEQPVGVGFSYADHGEVVSTTEEAAQDVAALFAILSAKFPQYHGRKLHLAGESYGGRYIPLFGAAIVDNNKLLVEHGAAPINLASVMIGNGASNWPAIKASYEPMLCTNASGVGPVLPISICVRMKQVNQRCIKQIQTNCVETHDLMDCGAVSSFCEIELLEPVWTTGRNPYDLRGYCQLEDLLDTLCYPETKDIRALLNKPYVRKLLNTDEEPKEFFSADFPMGDRFIRSGDMLASSDIHLSGLLERGVRVLLYAGMTDLMCSWLGVEATSRAIPWSGQDAFGAQEMKEWEVEGRKAGKTRKWNNLTFASVYDAGHQVPHDKPAEALVLLHRWLAEAEL